MKPYFNVSKLAQYPIALVLTIYLLWGGLLLAIYRTLRFAVPNAFSPGPLAFLLPQAIPALTSLIACWIMIRFVDRRTFASFGFTLKGFPAELLVGFSLGTLGYAGAMVISWLGGWYQVVSINPNYWPKLHSALLSSSCHRRRSHFQRIHFPSPGSVLGDKVGAHWLVACFWIDPCLQSQRRRSLAKRSYLSLGCPADLFWLCRGRFVFRSIFVDAPTVDTDWLTLRLGYWLHRIL